MPVNYNNTLKTERMADVLNAIDGGAGAGSIEICTAGYAAVLLVYALDDPCGSVAGDPAALAFSGMPKLAIAGSGGTAALGRIKDSNGVVIADGFTVTGTGGGGNFEIDNVNVQNGQTVNLTAGQIVHG